MTKLERCSHSARQDLQKFGEHGLIGFEIGRKLKENRAETLGALHEFKRSEKALQEFVRALQALDVREHLVRFDGKAEVLGRFGDPVLDGRLFHQLTEGVVDFDGIQLRRVEIQKFLLREFFGIEIGLPAWIRPSGSADVELSHSDCRGQSSDCRGRCN